MEEYANPVKKVQLYPNPAEGQVRMTWDGAFEGQICIVGVEGKELKRMNFSQTESVEFSTADLPKGCYTVMCLDKEGKVILMEKLIVK